MSLRINQTISDRDTTVLEVTPVNGEVEGAFLLAFLKPDTSGDKDEDYWITGNVTVGGTAASIWGSIRDYYRMGSVSGTNPVVTRTCRDFDGIDNENNCDLGADLISDYVYTIEVPRSISKPSCDMIMVIPTDTNADIKVTLPG